MKVRNEERDIVSLYASQNWLRLDDRRAGVTYLHRFASQDEERLRALSQESGKLMY